MKSLVTFVKLLSLVFFFYTPLFAGSMADSEPMYDRVYRSDKIADSYHFFLLTHNGTFYYLHTNKTDSLTPMELKSPNLMDILNQKQSWGQAFPSSGEYTKKNGKLYTKRYWDPINVFEGNKIKYLNKTFYLQ